MPERRSWPVDAGRLSLRARLTLLATGIVAISLALGALLLVLAVRHSVLNSLDDSARQQAKDVAALAGSGRLPDPVPVGAGTAGVQIVDAQDRVVAVSAGADRLTALLEPADVRAVRAGQVRVIGGARLGTPDSLRVVGYPVPPAGDAARGGQTVLVAVSQAEAAGSLRALAVATVIGAPVLVAGFALVCWLLVGRSLRPVSRLRTGAEEIAAAGRSDGRRLPVPLAQDEVRRLAETLNGMLDRLEAASTAQRAFVADAAHELRSPLTAIRTQLEVARRHPEAEAWEQTADGVLADTDRLARLVDDLLLLARSGDSTDRVERRARPVDLADLATQVAGAPWRVPVTVVPAVGGLPPLVADPDSITRILTNLVDNAARHAASAVQIGVREHAGRLELSVSDDGPGVPAADRERVFERFTRLDSARSRGDGGSGLGLAIVRSLVRASAGTVQLAEPAAGSGTVVLVSWARSGPVAGATGEVRGD